MGPQESQRIKDEFQAALDKVCDGSIYTDDRLSEVLGRKQGGVQRFVYMCEVCPDVSVTRRWSGGGGRGTWEFVFQRVPLDKVRDELVYDLLQVVSAAQGAINVSKRAMSKLGVEFVDPAEKAVHQP